MNDNQWQIAGQSHYDQEGTGELATEIVFTVAEAKGVDPVDTDRMEPIHSVLDFSSLERTFFDPSDDSEERNNAEIVLFTYSGMKVRVDRDGWISVYEPVESSHMN